MLIAVIALYVLGVALPVAGLVRLAIEARRAVKSAETEKRSAVVVGNPKDRLHFSIGDLTTAGRNAARAPFDSWRAVLRDLIFIGVGILASGTASIMSLFLE